MIPTTAVKRLEWEKSNLIQVSKYALIITVSCNEIYISNFEVTIFNTDPSISFNAMHGEPLLAIESLTPLTFRPVHVGS